MNKVQKQKLSKPNLIIQIEDFEKKINEFNQKHSKNQVALKPLRSAKNIHQLKKFNFEEQNIQNINHSQKLKKLHRLQRQKQNLIESLQILKESAVYAIAQKQDELQKLRNKDNLNNQQKLQFYEIELNISRKMRQQLKEQCAKLYREMREEKQKYIMELQEKQMFIQELHNQILIIRRQLDILEHNDIIKTKKIKILQEENTKLSVQLEMISMDHYVKDKYTHTIDLEEDHFKNHHKSPKSMTPDKNILTMLQSEHFFHSEEDKTFMSQKLYQINQHHREQLLQIRTHYERQISDLRQIYERELRLPTEENERSSSLRKRSKSISNTSQKKSFNNNNEQNKKNNLQQGFNLNLKSMNTIIQNVQQFLDTQRSKINILQKEIKMQNLSQCPSVQERLNTNSDNQSQFTTKYFDSTFRFLKKNKSTDNIQKDYVDNNETKTILKIKRQKDEVMHQNLVTQVEEKQQRGSKILQKSYLFMSGIASGVAITSIAKYFFNKS